MKRVIHTVVDQLNDFERCYESIAHAFEWTFARADLIALMARTRSRRAESQHLGAADRTISVRPLEVNCLGSLKNQTLR
jgi:hypothetical protein